MLTLVLLDYYVATSVLVKWFGEFTYTVTITLANVRSIPCMINGSYLRFNEMIQVFLYGYAKAVLFKSSGQENIETLSY